MLNRAILITVVLLAGCARSEDASVVADVNELQAAERVRTPEQDDEEIAIGEWREVLQEDQAALEFGPRGTTPLFSFRCDARRSVYLQRHGAVPAGDLPMMLVSVGSETRRLAVTGAGSAVPMLRASLAPSDPLLGTLASTTEPITIRIGEALPLMLPPGPAIATFLGRCESGSQPALAPAEPANTGDAAENGQAAEPAAER